MDAVQIFFNSVVVVFMLVRYSERMYAHSARNLLISTSFLAVALANFLLLVRHYEWQEAMLRGTSVALMFLGLSWVFVRLARRLGKS
jgi:hypothetical protein